MKSKSNLNKRLTYFSNPINVWKYFRVRFFPVKPISIFTLLRSAFDSKFGIEIGGPSAIFGKKNIFPIYPIAKCIDGCNFHSETLWELKLDHLGNYSFKDKNLGKQYIFEATNLSQIGDETYDFVISSHCLEHIANPLKAIEEWLRVLKPNGLLLIVVPKKQACFDHKRQYTTFDHIKADYNNQTTESDLTHLEEILELHDLTLDSHAGTYKAFKERCENNMRVRGMHHHVFDQKLLKNCLNYFNLESESTLDVSNIFAYGYKK